MDWHRINALTEVYVTTYARTCKYCGNSFEAKRPHAKFCTDKCRVYGHLYGDDQALPDQPAITSADTRDVSLTAALEAARRFTPVAVPDTKTASAIQVKRSSPDPNTWTVIVPAGSAIAGARIAEALRTHIGDLLTLANKLADGSGEPRMILRTSGRVKAKVQ